MGNNSNRQIVRNTSFLYVQTAITMMIALYSSRVVLKQLGVSDYGVYNVVGGVIAMLTTLSGTFSGATQRFITVAIGKKNTDYLQSIFSATFRVHIALALLALILAETLGVWFVNTQMNLPEGRLFAANFVFQTVAISFVADIITLPYNGAMRAYERFDVYAYLTIFQSVFRLVLILTLYLWPYDKLLVYGACELVVSLTFKLLIVVYGKIKFKDLRFVRLKDNSIYKDILSFTGWNFFGTASSVIYTQGSTLLLNVFYGVLWNAALGVAHQVQNAINTFVADFTMAVNPQIYKTYASNDWSRTRNLIFFGVKISSFLLLLIGSPILINLSYILNIWLVEVPDHTEIFISLSLLAALFGTFVNPFNTLMQAVGKLRNYQISCFIINTSSVIILYVLFKVGINPVAIFIITIVQNIVKWVLLADFSNKEIGFPVKEFVKKILFRNFCFLIPTIAFVVFKYYKTYQMTFGLFILESLAIVFVISLLFYIWGVNREEREQIRILIIHKFNRRVNEN